MRLIASSCTCSDRVGLPPHTSGEVPEPDQKVILCHQTPGA